MPKIDVLRISLAGWHFRILGAGTCTGLTDGRLTFLVSDFESRSGDAVENVTNMNVRRERKNARIGCEHGPEGARE